MSDAEANTEVPVKRGRGRPRKNPVAVAETSKPASNGTVKVPGKRGRPAGTGKKAKQPVASTEQGVKRGRGRPKKSEAEKAKNKKVKKTGSSDSEAQETSSPEEEESDD